MAEAWLLKHILLCCCILWSVQQVHAKSKNLHRPVIIVTNLQSSVREDAAVGTKIADITVEDGDTGFSGTVKGCDIQLGKLFRLQKVSEKYRLETASALDRESKDEHSIQIKCTDRGLPSKSGYKTVKVHVEDVNDNRPRFDRLTYYTSIKEGTEAGTFFFKVMATDADIGQNAVIRYSIVPKKDENETLFNIDQVTGSLMSATVLDRNNQSKHSFFVKATDQGVPPQSSIANVKVDVVDRNNNAPKFVKRTYLFTLDGSNFQDGTEVGKVVANDTDDPPFNKFVYVIDEVSAKRLFSIDENTGVITVKGSDSLKKSSYIFIVRARDSDAAGLYSSARVSIMMPTSAASAIYASHTIALVLLIMLFQEIYL